MRSNLDIQQLMTEKIGGIISAADEAYLDHLIESDRVVAAAWDNTKDLYRQEDIDNHFQRFETLPWQEMPFQTVLPDQKIRQWISPLAWAAAIALLISVTSAWWLVRSHTPAKPSLALSETQGDVQLQTGNGQLLNLSKDTGLLHTGTLQAINTNNTLSMPVSTIGETTGNDNLTLTVPIAQHYSIKLSDGTVVSLNSVSSLRFPVPFTAGSREVYLTGEAYFAVAHDATRPFLVHTPQGTVQVLGTAFNVNTYDSTVVKVSLVEGAVKMEQVALKPGQQAVASTSGIRVQPFDETTELSWRQGIFYFSNTSLADIARILPRWFGTPIIMDNPHIARETFTGSVERSQPITVFLENLKSTTTVDYYFDKTGQLHFK
ncbi:FecR family protein [Chitinophaga qingshengii]|uniref:FecR domain-containing protein n=1 Tax=Chitinophaga qingshengii TaxID=1569794 RepID=A0ABR7THL6_9BACT|nr:FecR domain-containing protein [Chitinophaga qingshengii]MBC9929095.1 FecR domain-containing protein [Chitinophaga qingshengii]